MSHDNWMIYGANGYTGKIAAEQAAEKGRRPLLAGRSEAKVKPVADALKLDYVIFDLADVTATEKALTDVDLVLHCAGPFSATSKPMVDACLKTKTHYLDITGEIAVFEDIHGRDAEAKQAGVALIPGVGFDIVPSDCLAALLAQQLPGATHLEMAFCGEGGASPGTAKTMVEMLGDGGRERINGDIVKIGNGKYQKEIVFSIGKRWCMTIPWGDVSTAFYSTGIPNIRIYTGVPKGAATTVKIMSPLMAVTKLGFVQNFLKSQIEKKVTGPNEKERLDGSMNLWGKVTNAKGDSKEAYLDVAEGYGFTVMASLEVADRIMHDGIESGSLTPSMAFGGHFVTELAGSKFKFLG
ncbi:MAG: short subunit dehydrogenase-like uncharacterized protein [Pseudomonadales bacterium]|jgi:short subunit dehydrogenase-like uncharacterized protein